MAIQMPRFSTRQRLALALVVLFVRSRQRPAVGAITVVLPEQP